MFSLTPEGHRTAAVSRRAWGQDAQAGGSGLMEYLGDTDSFQVMVKNNTIRKK